MAPMHTIILYATPGCRYCDEARAALATAGQAYEERNPLDSPARVKELMLLSAAFAVPTIVVSGKVLVGFDQARLDELLQETPPEPTPPDDYVPEDVEEA